MEDLLGYLPHWIPSNGDKIVYSTVDEGGSASITDVGKYHGFGVSCDQLQIKAFCLHQIPMGCRTYTKCLKYAGMNTEITINTTLQRK